MSKENMKPAVQDKPNRIAQFLNTEYKFENFLLVALSLFAIVFGVLILQDTFSIPADAFLVGQYGDVFAWVLIVLGVISLLLWAIPFYRPSVSEIKHIKGLKRRLRVGFGKCQGGMCQSVALEILANFYGVDKKDIPYDNPKAFILLKKTKGEN